MERNIPDSDGGVISEPTTNPEGDLTDAPTEPPENRPGFTPWDYDPPTPSAVLRHELAILTEEELARALGISIQTLVVWRGNGEGPAYAKLGRRVYYPHSAVKEWIGENWQDPKPAPRKRQAMQSATGPVYVDGARQLDLEEAIAAALPGNWYGGKS
jgi:predicted DNA-binding transcriptional regulator AlpA